MVLTQSYQLIASSTYRVSGNNELRIYGKYNSQSIASNKSSISINLRTIALDGYYYSSGNTSWLTCSGDRGAIYYDIGTVNTSSEKDIGTWTFDLEHGSDGKLLNVSVTATANVYASLYPSVSGYFDLPTIARQANITSAPDFNDEENPTVEYSNPAGDNVTTLQMAIQDSTGNTTYANYRDVSKTGSSYTFNLTTTERNNLRNATPNSNTLPIKFSIKTILGGNTYFSKVDKTLSIVNANPEFDDFNFEDVNATTVNLTGSTLNNVINVNGFSNIKATIPSSEKATAKKYATISKYRFSIVDSSADINYSSSSSVNGTINGAKDGIYVVYAIDSRNNSTSVIKQANSIIAYDKITINKTNSSLVRNNNQVGVNAILTLEGTFWNSSFGQVTNTIKSVTYKLKKSNSSTWITGTTTITPTTSGNTFSFTGQIASDNQDTTWDLNATYNVQLTISDELSSATVDFILNSAIPTICLDKNGLGVMCAYNSTIGSSLQIDGKSLDQYILDVVNNN